MQSELSAPCTVRKGAPKTHIAFLGTALLAKALDLRSDLRRSAALKLDADWVILSARNTAAGGASGAEALSGLARAFFYAQARALLVSHWEVASDTTVKLITGAMRRLAADKTMGRAEAMRQSMLALIDTGTPQEARPAFWAPFVVVGEGGISAPVHSDKRKLGEVHPTSWATSTTAGKSSAPH